MAGRVEGARQSQQRVEQTRQQIAPARRNNAGATKNTGAATGGSDARTRAGAQLTAKPAEFFLTANRQRQRQYIVRPKQ